MTQSQKRFSESLGANFSHELGVIGTKEFIFLKSSSDEGVIRNGGRNGARYAPQSLLSAFKKLTKDEKTSDYTFKEMEVSCPHEEAQDFALGQRKETERINEIIKEKIMAPLCHIGGGHDHIYPLAMALGQAYSRLIIINLDAHADTRTDREGNSGTPLRQLSRQYSGDFYLFQIGLHPFANSASTLSPIENGTMSILWRNELYDKHKIESFYKDIKKLVTPDTLVIFSLDADVLDGSEAPGVSAVNSNGLSLSDLKICWENYMALDFYHPSVLGIYELNPVYDTLSSVSMRKMASFIFETL